MAVKHVKGTLESLTIQMHQCFCLVQWLSTQFLEAALESLYILYAFLIKQTRFRLSAH